MPSSHIRVSDKVKERIQSLAKELGFKTMGEFIEYLLSFDPYVKKLRELKLKEKLLEIEYKIELLEKKKQIIEELMNMDKEIEDCYKVLVELKKKPKENKSSQKEKIDLVYAYNYLLAYFLANSLSKKDKEKILSLSEEKAIEYIKKIYPNLQITIEAIKIFKIENENLENSPMLKIIKRLEKELI